MLYFFYGDECPHCHVVMPLVDDLITKGYSIQKLETWHHEENEKIRVGFDTGMCGGVPFFYNDESKQWICGSADAKKLERWAKGENL